MMSRYKESVLSSSFDYKKYLVRRCGKFYPLHWLCLLVSVPLVVRPSGSIKQIGLFVLNAALLQSWVPVRKVYFCFNAVSWYLADTIFFTILFPFVFRWIASATLRGRTLIAGAIAFNVYNGRGAIAEAEKLAADGDKPKVKTKSSKKK